MYGEKMCLDTIFILTDLNLFVRMTQFPPKNKIAADQEQVYAAQIII